MHFPTKREIVFLLLLLILGAFLLVPKDYFSRAKLSEIEGKSQEFFTAILPQKVIDPEPLRYDSPSSSSHLTMDGVLLETNTQRATEHLKPLVSNPKLNATASAKAKDIFAKQYFAHVSPSGVSAGDLAKQNGYQYIIIGENLALGNFKDDAELVKAWMESPGHRANIMNKRYEEIGVAVLKGRFEGRSQWVAVQTFGVPASSCPSPEVNLKKKIDEENGKATLLEAQLKDKKAQIDAMEPKRGEAYSKAVQEYNALVGEYNAILRNLKTDIATYNDEVKDYNNCVAG